VGVEVGDRKRVEATRKKKPPVGLTQHLQNKQVGQAEPKKGEKNTKRDGRVRNCKGEAVQKPRISVLKSQKSLYGDSCRAKVKPQKKGQKPGPWETGKAIARGGNGSGRVNWGKQGVKVVANPAQQIGVVYDGNQGPAGGYGGNMTN